MDISRFLSKTEIIGNASWCGGSGAASYASHQGAPFLEGTRGAMGFAKLPTRMLFPGGTTGSISNLWAFSLTAANSATDMFGVRWLNGGTQPFQLYIAKTGESAATFTNEANDAPANTYVRFGGFVPVLWFNDSNDFTLCQLLTARYADSAPLLHKTEHTLGWDFDWDDYQSAGSGYSVFGKAHPSQSGTPIPGISGFILASKRDGFDWSDIGFDDDEQIKLFMQDPATFMAATPWFWQKILSPSIVDGSGGKVSRSRAIVAGTDKLRCVHTNTEWAFTTAGTLWARVPHADPAEKPQAFNAIGVGPVAIEQNGVVVEAGLQVDNNATGTAQITRRRPEDGAMIAPPVYIPEASIFFDDSNGDAETRYNGFVAARAIESHEGFAVALEPNGTAIHAARCFHNVANGNTPATGDVLIDSGCVTVYTPGKLPITTPFPTKGATDTDAGFGYIIGIMRNGVSHWAGRRGNTGTGFASLARCNAAGIVDTQRISDDAYESAEVGAGFTTNFAMINDSEAIATYAIRLRGTGSEVYTGVANDWCYIVNFDTGKVYAGRTGADVTASLGTLTWHDHRFWMQPGPAQTAAIAGTFDGQTQTDERFSCLSGNSVFTYSNGEDDFIGYYQTRGSDPNHGNGATNAEFRWSGHYIEVFSYNRTTHVQTFSHEVDITELLQAMGPETSVINASYDDWEMQEPVVVYNTGGDLVIALPISGATDLSSSDILAGGTRFRIGSKVSMGVVRQWWKTAPETQAWVDEIDATTYGGVGLAPYMIHNSRSMGLRIMVSGTSMAGTGQNAGNAYYVSLNKYLEATPVITAEEIVDAINASEDLDDKIADAARTVVPQDKVSVSVAVDGSDLDLLITASGETITAYSLKLVAITRSDPYTQHTASAGGSSAQAVTATIASQAALAEEDLDVYVTVTTSQSGVLPQEKIRWRPQTAVLEAIGGIEADPTPLAERPSAPNRTRKVRRSITGGLTFDAITVRVGDTSAVWCLDFASDLAQGTGIASVAAPTFDADTGLALADDPERTGDRPSKGVVMKFEPTTAGTYTMTMEVTYGDSQGTHTVQGTVTVLEGAE